MMIIYNGSIGSTSYTNQTESLYGKEELEMANVILASHGELSKGMLDTVKMIIGDMAEGVETYSLLPGANADDFAAELKQRIDADEEEYIIICDVLGGSVCNSLVQLTVNERVKVLAGMNLPLVIEIAVANQTGDIDLDTIIQTGKDGVSQTSILAASDEEDSDF